MACKGYGSHKLHVQYILNNTESVDAENGRRSSSSSGSHDRPYRCDMCQGSFKIKGDLVKHRKNVHFGEKRFECSICQLQFSEKGNLNKHNARFHVDTKEHPCRVAGCMSEFATSDGLLRHMRQVHRIESSSSSSTSNRGASRPHS